MKPFWNIPELKTMTAQEVFDKALNHVLTTKAKSCNDASCLYSGIGCAASVFLLEEYRKEADLLFGSSGWRYLVYDELVIDNHSPLIRAIQHAHDGADNDCFLINFLAGMRRVAREFALAMPDNV